MFLGGSTVGNLGSKGGEENLRFLDLKVSRFQCMQRPKVFGQELRESYLFDLKFGLKKIVVGLGSQIRGVTQAKPSLFRA